MDARRLLSRGSNELESFAQDSKKASGRKPAEPVVWTRRLVACLMVSMVFADGEIMIGFPHKVGDLALRSSLLQHYVIVQSP